MSIPIIKTKLYIPKLRSSIVVRSKLVDQISKNIDCKLTLISAPTGFGKSTLISEWAKSSNYPFAWLSLEEKDNDLIRFLSYFIAALQTIEKDICQGIQEMFHSMEAMGTDFLLTAIINEIETLSTSVVFVLDDYHLINNQEINDGLSFLLDHLPSNMRLVIITREEPLFSLSSLRSKNQLIEIRTKDLRFTHSESVSFFNQVMDIKLSDKDIKVLESRTEGWIAGLQLAGISLQKQKDIPEFIESFSGSHKFIMDYLVEEVFSQLSEERQSFLLQTSILDRLSGPLCDGIRLNSVESGQQTLEYLHNRNMFVVPLDDEGKWYRYHHLFLDLLREKVLKEYPLKIGVNVSELHRRASEWFENNDLINDAVHHAVLGKDFEKAADLIELSWSEMDQNLQSGLWLSWVKTIPHDIVRSRPILSVGYAWALLDSGVSEGCEKWLNDAEKCIEILSKNKIQQTELLLDITVVDEKQYKILPATIAAAKGYIALVRGEVKTAIGYIKKALGLFPEGECYNKDVINTMLGLAQWTNGELEEAYNTIINGTKNLTVEIMVAVVLADLSIEQGKLDQAFMIYEKALLDTINKKNIYQMPIASFYVGLGNIELLRGNLGKAEVLLQKSINQSKKGALPNWQYKWHLLKARVSESKGEFKSSLDLYHKSEFYHFDDPLPDPYPLSALKVRVMIKQGKIHTALEWVKKQQLSIEDELSYLGEYEHITFVRVLIGEFRYFNNDKALSDAKQFIKRLLTEAIKGERTGRVVELYILQALAEDYDGELELALKSLKNAIRLAEAEEYIQIFIDEGIHMYLLLSKLTADFAHSIYFLKLLKMFEEAMAINESNSKMIQMDIEPLTKREQEVLTLIAQGLTNREISERLFLALSTIKNYNQNLYEKLEVKNRTAAISRARELGLV
ncbi:MAG: hypothetical protein JEZ08_05985 [Clostridiales bacterium]|nr:hypothetical protein [Clostridiales bacterium]